MKMKLFIFATFLFLTCLTGTSQMISAQTTISLGQASQYAVLGRQLHLHNCDIFGNAGIGNGSVCSPAPGYNMKFESPGILHGIAYTQNGAILDGQTGNATGGIVNADASITQAFADAMTAYNNALTLIPDVTYGNVNGVTVSATHGGQYVVKVTGNITGPLTLDSFPGQTTTFIVIVDGTITLGGSDVIGAPTQAGSKNVLFVINGTGNDLTSHINNFVNGTMLAPFRGATFHGFRGALITGCEYVKFQSDAQINYVGFEPYDPCAGDTIAPQFVAPTPCDTTITDDSGDPITFTVQAQDNSAGSVTLDVDSLPPGATMTPSLPHSGNPVSSIFNWTPTVFGPLTIMFTATDSCGNQATCRIHFDLPLPVELTSFTSLINNNEVTLNWSTATESNNSRFEIERANGNWQEWNMVGTIQGNGNSTQPISYSFVDRGLNVGSYNYRLKQIDFNGDFTYHNLSNEVIIGVPTRFNLSQNYPNPFNPSTKIDFEIPKDGNVNLYVYDNSGKQVSTLVNGFKTAGYYTVQFNASNLASGIYYYKIQYSGEQPFEKILKMALLK